MTSEPRRPDKPRPDHVDHAAGASDRTDDLDQAFAEVESEVGVQGGGEVSAPDGHAEADHFVAMNIDDVDDVFVIDDDEDLGSDPSPAPAGATDGHGTRASGGTEQREDTDIRAASRMPRTAAGRFGASVDDDSGAAVDDELFAPPGEVAASERFGGESTFDDSSDSGSWGGAELSPEDIGIDARLGDDQPSDEEEEDSWSTEEPELEILEEEGAEDVGDFAVVENDPVEQFGIQPVDEVEVSAPASGVWEGASSTTSFYGTPAHEEPAEDYAAEEDHAQYAEADAGELHDGEDHSEAADQDEYDPIYGAEAAEPAATMAYAAVEDQAPDYSEHEESYVHQAVPAFVGAPTRRRRRGMVLAAAAAALVVLGVGAGIAVMQPQWLGLDSAPILIDRTVVERPTISLAVEPPPPPARDLVAGSEPPVETGPETTPRDPVATTEPQQTPPDQPVEVVTTEPVPPPVETPPTDPPAETPVDVAATDPPVTTDPPADTLPIELPPQVVTSGASDREIMRIGEDLQIRPADPQSRPRVHHLAAGLSNGSQAFAQLKNMNFFLGRVKAMDSSFLTLDLAPGEITLAFDALNAIVPLASEEYRLMHGSAEGFVRLTNRNKLFGKILTNSLADNVVLEVQQSQVVIPRETIEEVGAHTKSTVHVLEDNDSDWIKTLLQRQAGKSSGVSAPAPQTPPPAPPSDGR